LSPEHQHPGHAQETGSFGEAFLAHALTPQNLGALPNPEGFARPQRDCGDYIELYLRIQDEVISDARFLTEGCVQVVACGSALTCLIKGRPVSQALQVDAELIQAELGGLPPQHRHCAELAERTLKEALRDYWSRRRSPWRAVYPRR